MKICRQIPVFACLFVLFSSSLQAQPGFKVDIKKPKPYEERELRAEKTGDGKLKAQKRFFQNLTTHFNYHFNANVKLQEVLERAKSYHKDDYSELLSFYNYSRDVTKADSIQLDSIIYKSQTGIVMHDLRNDWADDLYLLWGAAYYLWDKLDSATLMFQFINYAFAEKEPDGYYIPVGTVKEGQNALSIATKEKGGLFGRTTSRNTAFLWQIRTLIDLGNFSEAAGLINTLKHDPAFPERLDTFLEEVQAYWFYKQRVWDSSANHLVLAAEGADTQQEKARWEYLAAQMYEKGGSIEKAKDLYARSIPHTTDPIMDVYARLNLVRLNKGNSDNYAEQNIAELLRMARRDKYEDYRDIIYYMAAQMEMERNNLDAAKQLLIKGSKYDNGNVAARNKAFLQIADLSYDQRKYKEAASFYDSIQMQMLTDADRDRIAERKPFLSKIVFNELVIERQDSLQKIAAMPEPERNALLAKMVKQIRKQRGLKDEPVTFGRSSSQPVPDLFNNNNAKGEWYFYNTTLKTQGQQQFKQIWGNRPNTDNWRRSSNVSQQFLAQNTGGNSQSGNAADAQDAADVSEETLSAHLPLTKEALKISNDSITNALNNLGNIFLKEAEDYLSAIDAWEALRARYPNYEKMDEVLFNLYYAYLRAGNLAKAQEIKNLLMQQHASSSYATMVATGKNASPSSGVSPQATKDYEAVYNMFIEGDFDRAIDAKRIADSTYQTNHWQPQLLYIESVYYIQQRQDSVAKNLLQILATQEAGNGMGKKAENLMQVLARRAEIEKELSEYQLQNQPENFRVTPSVVQAPVRNNPVQQKPVVSSPQVATNTNITKGVTPAAKDTVAVAKADPVPPAPDTVGVKPTPPSDVVVGKPNVDTVATVITQPKEPIKDTLTVAPPREIVTAKPEVVAPKPEVVAPKPEPPRPAADPNKFYFDPGAQHYAVVVLDKVDPIFVNEARNAFFRFTREKFDKLNLQAEINDISPTTRLVLVGNFNSAQAALDYTDLAKKLAVSEIVPWLKPEKYSFSIITARNLELLKKSGDWSNYKKFTDEHLPGKF